MEQFRKKFGKSSFLSSTLTLVWNSHDEEPGDANGQGLNDVWWVLGPDGTPIRETDSEGTNDDGY